MQIETWDVGRVKLCEQNPHINDAAVDAAGDPFWSHVAQTECGCWLWRGTTNGRYGTLHADGRHQYAHRYSYAIHISPIPARAMVLHDCDNPLCVNPGHLHLGNQLDNMREAAARNRTRCGERNPRAKLRVADVVAIREAASNGESYSSISRRTGVALSSVSLIVRRKLWRSVA